ncbi:MAG TPA: glycosyltransferase family 4 protein [bacterium]|jgi:glycosyltransferase involved in cell wall biosynthesis
MRLLHGNEMHFVRCPDGRVYATAVANYAWWVDYLAVFDEVLVVARMKQVAEMYPAESLAEGPGVRFEPLPDFRGPEDYLRKSHAVQRIMKEAISKCDAYLFRVPGTMGYLGAKELQKQGKPYALEVVGDPYDVFTAGSVKHPMRAFFRQWHARSLRSCCQNASATMYVTAAALQRRYPPSPQVFTTHYSDVELPAQAYASAPRNGIQRGDTFKLIFIGTLAQLYKAPDVLIDAVHLCHQRGLNVSLAFAGDGACRPALEAQAARYGLSGHIRFLGHVGDPAALTRLLDEADVFVLPSRAEGLPRAMMEAMARALPCIGSDVDGIPELLAPEDLVPPNDPKALADKIIEVSADSARRNRMSARNLKRAADFRTEIMMERKVSFCRYIYDMSLVQSIRQARPTEVTA